MRKVIIKVCGMREPENIREVESLDVDLLGFIFYSGSSRYVVDSDESDGVIRDCAKLKVGVFVNEQLEVILDRAMRYRLDHIQLHGDETPSLCLELRQHGYHVIKTFSVSSKDDFAKTDCYADCCDHYLFDTKCIGYGGSGKRFDWTLLDEYKGSTPFILSGGLTGDCIDDLRRINHAKFSGIDLNSGFELSPAVKDVGKLKDFIGKTRKTIDN